MGYRNSLRLTILIVFALLYFLRRPADALYPYVWDEDGMFNIPQAIHFGWSSILIPINGYLLVPSKLLTLLTLSLSGLFYPEVAYVLTLAATLAVLAILTSKYVALESIIFLPLIIALLPYDPEVFSTPLYIFWWTSLLLLVPLLAPHPEPGFKRRDQIMLAGLVLMGGFSSPLCIVLWPMMLLRAGLTQTGRDYLWLGLWTGCALVQFFLSWLSSPAGTTLSLGHAINTGALPAFIGNFIWYGSWFARANGVTDLLFISLVGAAIYSIVRAIKTQQIEPFYQAFPLVGLFGSIMAVLVRLGFAPEPMVGGPRYFFFPYIFLALFLLATATYTRLTVVRYGCVGLLVAACSLTWLSYPAGFFRIHDPLNWRVELRSCVQSPTPFPVQIHFDGILDHVWSRTLSPEECQQIADSGLLARLFGLNHEKLAQF